MPLYIASEYEIQLVKLYGHDFLLVDVKSDFTTGRLKKYLDTIGAKLDTKGIAVIAQLEAYKRIRLIEKRIPFIIPGKQMYLPDLLIDLKEFGNKPKGLPATMRPATQFLLLYHLQVGPLDGIISSYRVPIGKMTFGFTTFRKLRIELPSIEEQTAIATIFQTANKEIQLLKAKLDKLKEQKKGLMLTKKND